MGRTTLEIKKNNFLINGELVYSEIKNSKDSQGLLMNSRFIQGIFDDKIDRTRFDRFGKKFDPDKNTDDLIKALPKWYDYGLRAFTVGIQGGWPVFTIDVEDINNNPFGTDGKEFDEKYAERLDRLIKAADSLGMVVIVNILYWAQAKRLKDGMAIKSALKNAARFLRDGKYTNVIIDLANEYDIEPWNYHSFMRSPDTMQILIDMVRKESGGLPIGSSGGGGSIHKNVIDYSDVILLHGNGLTQGEYYDLIKKIKEIAPDKPIVCNEDSPCFTRLDVAKQTHTSWGYYNNFTKQEPPCDWGITKGQDEFFARRMAKNVGIEIDELPIDEQFYLQGLEENTSWDNKRWIHVAAEYPEKVNYVDFYYNNQFVYRSYDEPFFLFRETTWIQKGWTIQESGEWKVKIVLNDGKIIEKAKSV
ncbi:MAG TPA: cellulase family glycosylhydrolase [Clostridia bacterium]|nr:cellulase family glycosylhydrolase [Clostridia bacterium]